MCWRHGRSSRASRPDARATRATRGWLLAPGRRALRALPAGLVDHRAGARPGLRRASVAERPSGAWRRRSTGSRTWSGTAAGPGGDAMHEVGLMQMPWSSPWSRPGRQGASRIHRSPCASAGWRASTRRRWRSPSTWSPQARRRRGPSSRRAGAGRLLLRRAAGGSSGRTTWSSPAPTAAG